MTPSTGSRMGGTRVIGGKTTSALSSEPSLKSIGREISSGSTTSTGFAEKRSIDFRGSPASQTMKPMGKQAKGTKQSAAIISQMREPLPTVEGMTVGKVSPQQQRFVSPLQLPQIRRTEPTYEVESEVMQTRKQRQEVIFSPQLTGYESLTGVTTARQQSTEISKRAEQQRASAIMQDVRRAQTFETARATSQRQTLGITRDVSTLLDTEYGIRQTITPSKTTAQRTVPSTKTTEEPYVFQRTITTTLPPEITNTKVPSGNLPFWGGSSQGDQPLRKGRRAHREVIGIRSSLMSFFGRRR